MLCLCTDAKDGIAAIIVRALVAEGLARVGNFIVLLVLKRQDLECHQESELTN